MLQIEWKQKHKSEHGTCDKKILTPPSIKICPLFDEAKKGIFYPPPSCMFQCHLLGNFFWKVSLMKIISVLLSKQNCRGLWRTLRENIYWLIFGYFTFILWRKWVDFVTKYRNFNQYREQIVIFSFFWFILRSTQAEWQTFDVYFSEYFIRMIWIELYFALISPLLNNISYILGCTRHIKSRVFTFFWTQLNVSRLCKL